MSMWKWRIIAFCLLAVGVYAGYGVWNEHFDKNEILVGATWDIPLSVDYQRWDNQRDEIAKDLKKLELELVFAEKTMESLQGEGYGGQLCGVEDNQGNVIISPIYESIYVDFDAECILGQNYDEGKYHYYNYDGSDFTQGHFQFAGGFEDGYATVEKDGKSMILDASGNIVPLDKYDVIKKASSNRILVEYRDERNYQVYAYLDNDFTHITKNTYKYATVFSDGVAAVKNNKGWCIINEEEQIVADLSGLTDCENINTFSEGIAVAECKRDLKYIDRQGNILFSIPYKPKLYGESSMWEFQEGKIVFRGENKKLGYMDKNGSIIVPPTFDYAGTVYENMAYVQVGGKGGVIRF